MVQGVAVPLPSCRRIEARVRVFCVELPQGLDHGLMYGGNGRERMPG